MCYYNNGMFCYHGHVCISRVDLLLCIDKSYLFKYMSMIYTYLVYSCSSYNAQFCFVQAHEYVIRSLVAVLEMILYVTCIVCVSQCVVVNVII